MTGSILKTSEAQFKVRASGLLPQFITALWAEFRLGSFNQFSFLFSEKEFNKKIYNIQYLQSTLDI